MPPTVGVAPGTISLVFNQTGLGAWLNPGGAIPASPSEPQRVYLTDPIQPASTTPIVYIGAGPPRHPSAQACRVCSGARIRGLGEGEAPTLFANRVGFVKKLGVGGVLAVISLGILTAGAGVALALRR